jgi:hypothetical protein
LWEPRPHPRRAPSGEKFFASFFQKRRLSLFFFVKKNQKTFARIEARAWTRVR